MARDVREIANAVLDAADAAGQPPSRCSPKTCSESEFAGASS